MVDYTKPQYRDDTWNRWKKDKTGRGKATQQLTAQYTNKRVYQRLALSNPFLPSSAPVQGVNRKRQLFGQFLGSRFGQALDNRMLATQGHRMFDASDGTNPSPAVSAGVNRGGNAFR